ncbi:hypothetical protein A11S_2034 [Micavibrio aeruginosavorus EPB]|uniref:Uncharacterized protein n=1 Tax=Micavibrio aeruginosavorus EPB TaxID=349215 RepID=M4W061_9BACT|nr:hypothetical protein A11S_2034 [Micavibrio aeruginosavorus EPB]
MNISQRDWNAFLIGNVDTSNTCHFLSPLIVDFKPNRKIREAKTKGTPVRIPTSSR